MNKMKKLFAVIAAVVIFAAAGAVLADSATNSADIEAVKAQRLEQKKAVLDQRVEEGRLTQQQSDEIYSALKENQAVCDGSGSAQIGKKYGAGFGNGAGKGNGTGLGNGAGMGNRAGMGGKMGGMRNGNCQMTQN